MVYKTKFQQWVESLQEGDWVIDEQHGLAQVLLSIPSSQQYLCETRERESFWTTVDHIKPPHRIRWRKRPKKPRPKTLRRKHIQRRSGRKSLNVVANNPYYGIYLYVHEDLLPSDVMEYPCVVIHLSEDTVLLSFYRHAYAKPIVKEHTRTNTSKRQALLLAAEHAAHVYKTRY